MYMSEITTTGFTSNLQLLLLSFHGLRKLHVDCKTRLKIDVNGIITHGETLADLTVVNGSIYRQSGTSCMSAEDLRKIAIACPQLIKLCLNLYEIDPNTPEGDFLGPHPHTL
jgi:hypothetical protein